MTWHYEVFKHKGGTHSIGEVYVDDETEKPYGQTYGYDEPQGDTLEELIEDLEHMLEAAKSGKVREVDDNRNQRGLAIKEVAESLYKNFEETFKECEDCESEEEGKYKLCDVRILSANIMNETLRDFGFSIHHEKGLVENAAKKEAGND